MTKPLLELASPDSNFSVTVGRSSPTFIYGVRNLPDGQGGYPAFIFDTQALTTDRETGEVIVDPSYQYAYGGEDGRDLNSRSHEIPIGRFGFTRVDLTLTKDEEEDSDEVIYTREFEIAENFRRVTGETAFSAALGTESLGPITPGRDLRIGQNVKLRVWGLKVRVRVDGLANGQYGWECSVASVPMLTPRNITGSWTKRVSPSQGSSNGESYSGDVYDSGEMIHVGDEVSHLSERIRLLEDEHLVSNLGGYLEENRLQLMKKFRDGTEEIIDLGEISGGGGGLPDGIGIDPAYIISQPAHQSGHSLTMRGKFHGADRLNHELHTHLTDLSPKHSHSGWGYNTGYNVEDIGPMEPVTGQAPGVFIWNLGDDAEYTSPDDLPERPFQDPGLWAGTVFITVNLYGEKRLSVTAILSITWDSNGRRVDVVSRGGDHVLADNTINISSIGDRNLTVNLGLGDDPEGYPSGNVSSFFLPDYGEMLKAKGVRGDAGRGQFGKTTVDIPQYNEQFGVGLEIESFTLNGGVYGDIVKP